MTLITLAVLGHCWGLLQHTALNDQLFHFLYVWHMPAFVFVSGYVSRRFSWSGARLWQTVRTLVVPYLVFEAALAWLMIHVGDERPLDLFLAPLWPLWYLCALVLWRLAAPVLLRVPWPLAVAGSVAASLVGGVVDYPYFAVSRFLGLLPFFVLGLVVTPGVLERVRSVPARVVGVGALIVTLVLARFTDSWASTYQLYYFGYEALGVSDSRGMVVRSVVLVLALSCTIGVLSLVPATGGWFARMGSATMVVFLVHGLVVRLLEYGGVPEWAARHPAVAPLVVATGAVGLSLGLASPPVSRVLAHVVDPIAWAQGHVRHAVDLSMAVARHEWEHEWEKYVTTASVEAMRVPVLAR